MGAHHGDSDRSVVADELVLVFCYWTSTHVDTQQAVLVAALNLGIGVPVFRFIVMHAILKGK